MLDIQRYDKIVINDLFLRCTIGFKAWEKDKLQDVLVNLTLYVEPCVFDDSYVDDIEGKLNYKAVIKTVITHVENSSYNLLETLVNNVAKIILNFPEIKATQVRVDKVGALRFSKSVAIDIFRKKEAVVC